MPNTFSQHMPCWGIIRTDPSTIDIVAVVLYSSPRTAIFGVGEVWISEIVALPSPDLYSPSPHSHRGLIIEGDLPFRGGGSSTGGRCSCPQAGSAGGSVPHHRWHTITWTPSELIRNKQWFHTTCDSRSWRRLTVDLCRHTSLVNDSSIH